MNFLTTVVRAFVVVLVAAGYATAFEVVRVWPEKLLYASQATAQVTVTLRNAKTTEQQAELVVTLITDVATERELLRRAVNVPAGANEEVVVSAPLREEFGHEVRAVLIQDGKEISRVREFFTVTDHAPLVSQYTAWVPSAGSEKIIRESAVPLARANYISMAEIYDWSPCTLADFTPHADEWCGGSNHYHCTKSAMRTLVAEAHRHGIQLLTYVNNAFWGARAWETLREHPEWALYTGDGQWYARFNFEQTGGLPRTIPEPFDKNSACYTNFSDVRVVDHSVTAMIDGMQMFGFDGARWDGQWTVSGDYGTADYFDVQGHLNARHPEADELAARNHRRAKEQLRKARPGFLCGYNYGVRVSEGAATTLPKFYAETIGDRGWLLWETALPMMQGAYDGVDTWALADLAIRQEATHVRNAGGEVYMHVLSGSQIYNAYLCALAFSNRAHLSSPKNLGHWYKFALRYGGILYDPCLKPAEADSLTVQSEAPLWWRDKIYRRALSARREQLIVHLINPPDNERLDVKETAAPPPRKNVVVSVSVPAGSTLSAAWVLSPDPDTHATELTPTITARTATFTMPDLAIWNVLVCEFERKGK